MKRLLFIGLLLLFSVAIYSQEKDMNIANRAFVQRNYAQAVKYYKKVLRKTNDFQRQKIVAYQIALGYYKMGDYNNAETWFADAIGNKIDSLKAYLYYADILSISKKYEDAISVLSKAVKIFPKDINLINKIQANKLIISQQKLDTLHLVKKVEALNSDYSDYGLGWWDNKIVFASTRSIKYGSEMDGRTGQGFSKLYYAEKDMATGEWSRVMDMPSRFNTPYNDGAFAFDSVHNIAYWTSCNERSRICLIYKSHFNKYKKQWQHAEKVSFMLDDYNYGHVSVANNGNTLYFISNMTGGYGNNDIWKISKKDDGQWGIPVNLGAEINTSYNEMFPTMIGDSILFFSSEGHNSLGGLDIFFSMKTNLGFSKPIRLSYPLNSAADDFSLLLNRKGTRGYFCSNRDLKTGDDIYTFNGFPEKITVAGTVHHSLDNSYISNATIIFIDAKGLTDTILSDKRGKYSYLLNIFDDYRVIVKKKGYYDDRRTFTTYDKALLLLPSPQKVIDFLLTKRQYPCGISGVVTKRQDNSPMENVKVSIWNEEGFSTYVITDLNGKYSFDGLKPNTIYTVKTGKKGYFSESRVCTLPKVNKSKIFNKANGYDMDFKLTLIRKNTEIVLSNIYYDFDKATLRETSKIELDKLASMLKETPNVVVQISAHTDTRGSAAYNLKLSAERAVSVVDYLVSKGVSRNRLIAKGYGESRPLIPNANTEEEHQANRRTTFKVLEVNHQGKTIVEAESGQGIFIGKNVSGLVYHIQLFTTSQNLNINKDFEKLKIKIPEIKIFKIPYGKMYKYEAGETSTESDAMVLRKILRNSGYQDCFIVPYYKGRKITVNQAKILERGGSL